MKCLPLFCLLIASAPIPTVCAQTGPAQLDSIANIRFVKGHNTVATLGNGSDSLDGLAPTSAKDSIYGAMVDLINTDPGLGGGTINLIQRNSDYGPIYATPSAGLFPQSASLHGGIWIMAPGDANYIETARSVRSSNRVMVTTNTALPINSAWYQTGRTLSVFSCLDRTFDGNFVITGWSGTTITYNQTGASGDTRGCVITPIGWVPQNNRGFDFFCAGATNGTGPGGPGPNCSLIAGQAGLGSASISAINESDHIVTVRTNARANVFPGLPVRISYVDTEGYNGLFIVLTVVSDTQFTYYDPQADLATDSTGTAETQLPSIWLSGVGHTMFERVTASSALPLLENVDSNGNPTSAPSASSNRFNRVAFDVLFNDDPNAGPATWIGDDLLWVYFDDCDWSTDPAAPVNDDHRAAIVMKATAFGTTGLTSGLVHVWHGNSEGGGGVRWYQQLGSSSISIDGFLQEGGGQSQPILEVMSRAGSLQASVNAAGISDSGDHRPVVKVPAYANLTSSAINVTNCNVPNCVEGPATIFNTLQPSDSTLRSHTSPVISPEASGQYGIGGGRAFNIQVDNTRRNFVPINVIQQNVIASSLNPSAWRPAWGTAVSIDSGAPAPDGSARAASLTCKSGDPDRGNSCAVQVYSASRTFAVGDYVVLEVWTRASDHSAGIYSGFARSLAISGPALEGATYATDQTFFPSGTNPFTYDDGAWQREFVWSKVTAAGTFNTALTLAFSPTHPMNYFAPALYHISGKQVAVPVAPALSQGAGGSLAATTYRVWTTFTNAVGETNIQANPTTFRALANSVIEVVSPPPSAGATGWNVYVGDDGMCAPRGFSAPRHGDRLAPGEWCAIKQNSSPIPIGTNWREPISGLLTFSSWYAGAQGPAGQTAPLNDTTNAFSDSEVAAFALNLASYNATCSPDQLCDTVGPVARGGISTKSGAYTLTPFDGWVNVSGATTITVPHTIAGQRWVVFNSGSDTVTVRPDNGRINDAPQITMLPNSGREITCDGANCFAH